MKTTQQFRVFARDALQNKKLGIADFKDDFEGETLGFTFKIILH